LNLFPGENILEIDLNLNEILKKTIEISEPKGIEQCTLRIIDLKELVKNLRSYKELLRSINIICIITNSTRRNLENTRTLFSKLMQKLTTVKYFIIANFQDKKRITLEVEDIEKMLEKKTFGFSAVQKGSKEKMMSIIKNMLRITINEIKNVHENEIKEIIVKAKLNLVDIWPEIEKARIFEKQGKKLIAAKTFSTIASQLKGLGSEIDLIEEGEEVNVLYNLCKAWESMVLAEENKEPKSYSQAAEYFKDVSKCTTDSKLKLLALGNTEFCKALNLALEFDKRNQTKNKAEYYPEIKIFIKKAADLYRKGGFEREAEWALINSSYFDI
jgi:hypothetical protein